MIIMKKILITLTLIVAAVCTASAQEIKFEKLTQDLGHFPESSPQHTVVFKFKNVGSENLSITNAIASCGCTVPEYPTKPILPGQSGEIKVTYNGQGKFPGHFKKTVTIYATGKVEKTRLFIEGWMDEEK